MKAEAVPDDFASHARLWQIGSAIQAPVGRKYPALANQCYPTPKISSFIGAR